MGNQPQIINKRYLRAAKMDEKRPSQYDYRYSNFKLILLQEQSQKLRDGDTSSEANCHFWDQKRKS